MRLFFEDSRSLPEFAALCLLMLLLIAAPWLLGGVLMEHQFYLWIAALACAALSWLDGASTSATEHAAFPWWMLPVLLFLVLGGTQLLSVSFAKGDWTHVALPEWFPSLATRTSWTVDTALTRVQLVRFTAAAALMWSASHLLSSPANLQMVWWALAINGSVMSLFGVVQRIWWNGKLFWFVELTQGGQPFAAFVNRNHAAGYLNLCCAAAMALWWLSHTSAETRFGHQSSGKKLFSRGELLPAILVAINAMGVCASFSRGGILSLLIALIAVLMFSPRHFRGRILVLLLLIGLTVGGFLNVTNLGAPLRDRLATLQDASLKKDARWQHWQDTFPAALDAPWGTGLGTYRRANRPYQNHPTPGVFYNADNLYLDMLVEMGGFGLSLILASMLLLMWRVWQLSINTSPEAGSLGLLGVLLLVTQGVQSATDFGPLMTANLMTVAVLYGGLFAVIPVLDEAEAVWDFSRARGSYLGVGGGLILAGLLVVPVLDHARQVELLTRLSPDDRQPIRLTAVTPSLATAERLLHEFPGNGELQLLRSKLLILSYRAQVFEELRAQSSELSELQLWKRTSLPFLYDVVVNLKDASILEELRSHTAVSRYLVPASASFSTAINGAPLLPESRALLAMLLPLTDLTNDSSAGTRLLLEEAALTPDSPERLFQLGVLIRNGEDHQAREQLWKRALSLEPVRTGRLLKQMISVIGEAKVLALLPRDVPVWIEFVRAVQSADLRQSAARGLWTIVEQSQLPTDEASFAKGFAQVVLQDCDAALPHLRKAVDAQPARLEWRLELIAALEAVGLREEARQHLKVATQLEPNRRDLQRRLEEL